MANRGPSSITGRSPLTSQHEANLVGTSTACLQGTALLPTPAWPSCPSTAAMRPGQGKVLLGDRLLGNQQPGTRSRPPCCMHTQTHFMLPAYTNTLHAACTHKHTSAAGIYHALTHMRTHVYTHTHIPAHTDTQTHTRAHTHAHTHTYTRTHTHTHARTHARTHTHTYFRIPACRTSAYSHGQTQHSHLLPPRCTPTRMRFLGVHQHSKTVHHHVSMHMHATHTVVVCRSLPPPALLLVVYIYDISPILIA